MNIGEISEQSGLTAKTIRYYEDIGLVEPARKANGYREFCEVDLHKLAFLRRARSLGFSIEQCRELLDLYENRTRSSADVKRLAKAHLREIETKISELRSMHDTLAELVERCRGDARPDCPILNKLSDNEAANDA
jgi:Cu(I)-responsive transcriptional regulator